MRFHFLSLSLSLSMQRYASLVLWFWPFLQQINWTGLKPIYFPGNQNEIKTYHAGTFHKVERIRIETSKASVE